MQIAFWWNLTYFLASAADQHPSHNKSWHSQGHGCDTTEILDKKRYKHYTDTSAGIQDTTDKTDFSTANI